MTFYLLPHLKSRITPFNPQHGAKLPKQSLKAYNLTVKRKKIIKIIHFMKIARATVFNFIGTPLTLSLTGGWRILPTNFKTLLSQNTFKLKKSEKNCNPSLLSYGHLLLKRAPHAMPFYAFFA